MMNEGNWPALCDCIRTGCFGLSWRRVSGQWAQAHCVSCANFFALSSEMSEVAFLFIYLLIWFFINGKFLLDTGCLQCLWEPKKLLGEPT